MYVCMYVSILCICIYVSDVSIYTMYMYICMQCITKYTLTKFTGVDIVGVQG